MFYFINLTDLHPYVDELPMEMLLLEFSITIFRLKQFWKAPCPMFITLDGILKFVNF